MRFCIDFLVFFEGREPRKCCSRRGETLLFAKSTFSKTHRKMYEIWTVFGARIEGKTLKNGVRNHSVFGRCIFGVFFAIFGDFGSIC